MPGSAQIGNLAVNLSLETAAFQRGAAIAEKRAETMGARFKGAANAFSGLAATVGIGIGVTALVGLAKNAFEMASALDESAQKAGVTVEALQELNLAATQNGISEEALSGALAKLNKNMGLLAQGSKPAVEAFAKIGLAAEDLKGKSPDQALRIIADRLNALPTVQERVAVGAQLMGRGFSELLPLINGGSAGLDKYAETSRRNGQITTEEAKRLDELADSWERMKVRAGVATAKVIAGMVDYVSHANQFLANWESTRDRFIAAAESLASGAVGAINNMVSGIGRAITGRLNAIWEGAKEKIESVKQKFQDMYDSVVGHSYVPDMVKEIGYAMNQLQRVMVDPSSTAADKVSAIFEGLRGTLGQIFGGKHGGILDIIGQFAQTLIPLIFPGGKGVITEAGATTAGSGSVIGSPITYAAKGASGVFGGIGGVDKNVLSMNGSPIMRVSKGEGFRVSPANDRASEATVTIVPTPYFDAHVDGRAQVQVARYAPAIKADTMASINDRRRRASR